MNVNVKAAANNANNANNASNASNANKTILSLSSYQWGRALMKATKVIALPLCFFFGGCADNSKPMAAPMSAIKTPVIEGKLAAGDIFEVRVYDEKELSGTFRVGEQGTIDFPLVGTIKVKGLSAAETSRRITAGLSRYVKEPQVSIFIKAFTSQKVFVFGEVKQPGTFQYSKGMNVVEAITLAGGMSKIADVNKTYVTRSEEGGEHRIKVRIEDVARGQAPNVMLRPGDIVFVPESVF